MSEINLSVLTKGEVRSLAGHDRGLAARQLFDLDQLDKGQQPVSVLAPEDLDALTPSFVQGLFAASVHNLGKDAFYRHYEFRISKDLLTDVHLGVERILMPRKIAGTE